MRKELNPNVLVMKKHIITTLLTTFISCSTTFAQADGNIDFQQGAQRRGCEGSFEAFVPGGR